MPRGSSPGLSCHMAITVRSAVHIQEALSQAGVDEAKFSGHSFRIGAATAAAGAGLNDSFIQTLGRWKSSTFTAYIRTPIDKLTSVPSRLATQ